jgi:hypothetical protein
MIKSMYEIASKTYKKKGTISIFDIRMHGNIPIMQKFSIQKCEGSPRVVFSLDHVVNNPESIIIDKLYTNGNDDFCRNFYGLIKRIRISKLNGDPNKIIVSNGCNSDNKLIITRLEALKFELEYITGLKERTTIHGYAEDYEGIEAMDDAFQGMIDCTNHNYSIMDGTYRSMYRESIK